MPTPSQNANGHRRRELCRRVLAEESTCALCGQRVDKTLTYTPGSHGKKCVGRECKGCVPDPMRPEVDEDIPRSRGGSPYERSNTHMMHRSCNRWKSTMTLTEARAKFVAEKQTAQVTPSNIW